MLLQNLKNRTLLFIFTTLLLAASQEPTPINIKSDSATFDDKAGTYTYYGNVIATQGDKTIASDKLIIQRDANNKINTVIAQCDAKNLTRFSFKDKDNKIINGAAKTIKYFPLEKKLILLEQAKITEANNEITAPILTYYFETKILVSSKDSSKGERTSVIIKPKE